MNRMNKELSMSGLLIRLVELAEQYFNEYTIESLGLLHSLLAHDEEYTSDELIAIMANYSDTLNLRGL